MAVLKWDKEVNRRFVVMGLLGLVAVETLIKFLYQNMADYLLFIKRKKSVNDLLGILKMIFFLGPSLPGY